MTDGRGVAHPDLAGALLLDKPSGISSFHALSPVKRWFPGLRIGHTGTLDPFASGLLVALVGRATRLAPYITALDKEYVVVIRFGSETDTLDPEGEIVARGPVPDLALVESELAGFVGTIVQIPPRYSAVKVGGRRAYDVARSGGEVEMQPRTVMVSELKVLGWRPPDLTLRIRCSKGTYIRSIARDLGHACGTHASARELRRAAVGAFSVADARTITLPPDVGAGTRSTPAAGFDVAPRERLIRPTEALRRAGVIPLQVVPPEVAVRLKHGAIHDAGDLGESVPQGLCALVDPDDELVAVVETSGRAISYRLVY